MISKSKMSKKARRELDKQKRTTWAFSPVSRVKASKKLYSRKNKDSRLAADQDYERRY